MKEIVVKWKEGVFMKIKGKLYISFVVVNIIIVIVSIYSMGQMNNIRSQYDEVINEGVPELELIADMNFRIASQGAYIRAHFLGTASAKGNLEDTQKLLADRLDELAQSSDNSEIQEKINDVKALKVQFDSLANEAISRFERGEEEQAKVMVVDEIRIANEGLVTTLEEMETLIKASFTAQQEQSKQGALTALYILIAISIVGVAITLVVSTLVARHIATPIGRLAKATSVIAQGNLREDDINLSNKDYYLPLNPLKMGKNGRYARTRTRTYTQMRADQQLEIPFKSV